MKNIALSLVLFLFLSGVSLSVDKLMAAEIYEAGKHYTTIGEDKAGMSLGRVNVTEILWYGCPHCFQMESHLKLWKIGIGKNQKIEFNTEHATWDGVVKLHARFFYTLKALGQGDLLQDEIFQEIHINRNQLFRLTQMEKFLEEKAIDVSLFRDTYDSEQVTSMIDASNKKNTDINLRNVPAFIVNGRYKVTANDYISGDDVLSVVDYLIARELEE